MKKIYITGIILTSLVMMSSCAKFLDRQPLASVTSVGFYNTKDNTTLAVNAIYDVWTWERYGHILWAEGDCASDDAEVGGDPTILTDQFDAQNIMLYKTLSNNGYTTNFSKLCYTGIQRANNVLKGTDASNKNMNYDPSQLRGEASFMRAMLYFYLVSTMGPVPLITEPVSSDQYTTGNRQVGDDDKGTKQMEAIYTQIVTDLTYAASVLPSYASSSGGRATKAAAYGYLIKTYAVMASSPYIFADKKDYWNQIIVASDKIRAEDPRVLLDDYHKLFTVAGENCSESLFEIQFLTSGSYGPKGEGSEISIDESPRGLFGYTANYGYGLNCPTIDLVKQFDINIGTGTPIAWKDNWLLVPNPTPSDISTNDKFDAYLKGLIAAQKIDLMNNSKNGTVVDYDPRLDLIAKPGDSLYNSYDKKFYQIKAFKGNISPVFSVTGFWGMKTCSALVNGSDQTNQLNKKLLRYADVLLLEAEARFHTGDVAGATDIVNKVRTRAQNSRYVRDTTAKGDGLGYLKGYKIVAGNTPALYPAGSITLDQIKKERRLELFLEGTRFFDLVRWGMANDMAANRPTEFHGRAYSWRNDQSIIEPIPAIMINDGKGNVKQNLGY